MPFPDLAEFFLSAPALSRGGPPPGGLQAGRCRRSQGAHTSRESVRPPVANCEVADDGNVPLLAAAGCQAGMQ